jgi:hypothetical protein
MRRTMAANLQDFETLLAQAGLAVSTVTATGSGVTLIEVVPA